MTNMLASGNYGAAERAVPASTSRLIAPIHRQAARLTEHSELYDEVGDNLALIPHFAVDPLGKRLHLAEQLYRLRIFGVWFQVGNNLNQLLDRNHNACVILP